MMNYKTMTGAQLLEELSYMEQIGFPGEVAVLEIKEELAARKEAKNTPVKPMKALVPEVIKYGNHAEAYVYEDVIRFYGYEGGLKYMDRPTNGTLELEDVIGFYRSEYLGKGMFKKLTNR